VVLTHDHALDYDLCRGILLRGDAFWLGLIGSASKAARFRSRLLREGMDPERLASLTCPIGVPGIASKLPAAIAVAIAAQLLQQGAAAPAARSAADPHACNGACGICGTTRRKES
jgi:xanthine dehydrogenase accessory factor